jgi:hypothetical protein
VGATGFEPVTSSVSETTGNRCAPGRSPRSPSTVDGEVKCSLGVQLSGLSFATSHGALYAYARDIGLYSEHLMRLWTLLLDGAFIVAQLAAMLAGILRVPAAGRS